MSSDNSNNKRSREPTGVRRAVHAKKNDTLNVPPQSRTPSQAGSTHGGSEPRDDNSVFDFERFNEKLGEQGGETVSSSPINFDIEHNSDDEFKFGITPPPADAANATGSKGHSRGTTPGEPPTLRFTAPELPDFNSRNASARQQLWGSRRGLISHALEKVFICKTHTRFHSLHSEQGSEKGEWITVCPADKSGRTPSCEEFEADRYASVRGWLDQLDKSDLDPLYNPTRNVDKFLQESAFRLGEALPDTPRNYNSSQFRQSGKGVFEYFYSSVTAQSDFDKYFESGDWAKDDKSVRAYRELHKDRPTVVPASDHFTAPSLRADTTVSIDPSLLL